MERLRQDFLVMLLSLFLFFSVSRFWFYIDTFLTIAKSLNYKNMFVARQKQEKTLKHKSCKRHLGLQKF